MPVPPANPFAVLGMPARFDIDREAVARAHRRLVATLHPDRVADDFLRDEAVAGTAAANEARDVLLDDERRAEALLRLAGGPSAAEERALPEGFLEDVLDLRERMEAATEGGDAAARNGFLALAEARRSAHVAAVAALFAAHAAAPDREALRAIRRELNAWRYMERMRARE